ncbi:MAG TPA: hypothetical protein VF128_02565, partial [Gemmatimonadaceae bacterium]
SVVQVNGVPGPAFEAPDADAVVVVALKSRTNDPEEAVAWSLESLEWLLRAGAPPRHGRSRHGTRGRAARLGRRRRHGNPDDPRTRLV